MIKDWGLSHPTLEEVFLKLTKDSDEKNGDVSNNKIIREKGTSRLSIVETLK